MPYTAWTVSLQYAFLVNGGLMIAGAVVVFFGLISDPHDVGIHMDAPGKTEDKFERATEPIPFLKAVMLPGVIPVSTDATSCEHRHTSELPLATMEEVDIDSGVRMSWWSERKRGVFQYCLSNACLKLTNYAFFFWLPFYLTTRFNWHESKADEISIW